MFTTVSKRSAPDEAIDGTVQNRVFALTVLLKSHCFFEPMLPPRCSADHRHRAVLRH